MSEPVDAKLAEMLHTRAGNLPAAWHAARSDLLIASQVLKDRAEAFDPNYIAVGDLIPVEGRLGAVELMLKGMAVECFLKALWLKRGNTPVKDGRYVGVRGAGDHELSRLASAVGFVTDVPRPNRRAERSSFHGRG